MSKGALSEAAAHHLLFLSLKEKEIKEATRARQEGSCNRRSNAHKMSYRAFVSNEVSSCI
jgi:hypothetical protein